MKVKLENEAERERLSFAEIVRRALEKYFLSKKGPAAYDSLLSSQTVFEDQGPSDVSERHDHYLLERGPH